MSEKLYPLTYDIRREDPPLTREEVEAANRSACHAVVILSMIYPPDGSFSLLVNSLDGRTGDEVTDSELWKVWTMLASRLGKSRTLSEGKRVLAHDVWEAVCEVIRKAHGHS
jgi:hypothetical protein